MKHNNNKADSTERLVSLGILSDALLQSVMVFESWKKKDSLHQSAPLKSSFSHYLWNKKHRSQDTDLKILAFKICCSRNVENSLFTRSENVCILLQNNLTKHLTSSEAYAEAMTMNHLHWHWTALDFHSHSLSLLYLKHYIFFIFFFHLAVMAFKHQIQCR